LPFENWEEDHKLSPKVIIAALVIAMILSASVGYAIYKITSPPSAPVVISEPATLSAPSVNTTSAVTGDTLQLTTTLSDSKEGVQVFFYHNASASAIGSAYTNSAGQAILNYALTQVGTFTFTADCIHP
jgi:hypothetical protein